MSDTPKTPIIRQRQRLSQPAEQASPDYEVGYKKPPKASRFKPGQSGNPRGRPPKSPNLRTIVLEAMSEKVAVRTARGTRKMLIARALIMREIQAALKGDLRASNNVLKRYAEACPAETPEDAAASTIEELSEADEAIFEAYVAEFARRTGKGGK